MNKRKMSQEEARQFLCHYQYLDGAEKLFRFEYRWEVYTPVAKRKYGYYVLPVLYNNQFVARYEPESVRRAGEFRIKNWWWESRVSPDERMIKTIENEMNRFAKYLDVSCAKDNSKKIKCD